MAITHPTPIVNPLDALRLDEQHLSTPAAQRARLTGLLEAKSEAHRSAARLARWARPLAIATTAVSGVHLWETLAAVKPAGVAALSLPDGVYHGSALAMVAVIDASIIFLSAAGNTSAYAGYSQRSRALPLLYAITGGLNFAFLAAHWPALPDALRGAVLPALAVLFPVLLAVLVPALLVALERAAHVLQAARLALGVEVATLRGLVSDGADQRWLAEQLQQPAYAGPVLVGSPAFTWARTVAAPTPARVEAQDALQASSKACRAPRSYPCPRCSASLTAGAYGAAVRHGHCRSCKPA